MCLETDWDRGKYGRSATADKKSATTSSTWSTQSSDSEQGENKYVSDI